MSFIILIFFCGHNDKMVLIDNEQAVYMNYSEVMKAPKEYQALFDNLPTVEIRKECK